MEITINNLLEASTYFKDDKTCREYLEKKLWGDKPKCPHCSFEEKIYRYKNGKQFKCASCKKIFTITVGTPMENTNIPLQKWMVAVYLHVNNKKGISSHQLAKHIGITQYSAWFMLHRIRKMFDVIDEEKLQGIVEADETFVGGKNKNRHFDKKVKNSQGRSYKDKVPIFGVMQRGGKVISMKVPDTTKKTIRPLLLKYVSYDSILMTDEWNAYHGIGKYFEDHGIVFHGKGQYVNGEAYTNNMEGYWSHVKRSIIGCYHSISRKYMNLYCKEFDFRFNTRKMSDTWRFELALKHCINKTLSLKELKDVA